MPEKTSGNFCERDNKFMYHSKADARQSLVGSLKSKHIRPYPCPFHHGMWHITKDSADMFRKPQQMRRPLTPRADKRPNNKRYRYEHD